MNIIKSFNCVGVGHKRQTHDVKLKKRTSPLKKMK